MGQYDLKSDESDLNLRKGGTIAISQEKGYVFWDNVRGLGHKRVCLDGGY